MTKETEVIVERKTEETEKVSARELKFTGEKNPYCEKSLIDFLEEEMKDFYEFLEKCNI